MGKNRNRSKLQNGLRSKFGSQPSAFSPQPSAEFTLLRGKISANSEETERSGWEPVHTEGVCSGGKQVMFEPIRFRWVSSPCLTHLNMHPVGHALVDEEIDDILEITEITRLKIKVKRTKKLTTIF